MKLIAAVKLTVIGPYFARVTMGVSTNCIITGRGSMTVRVPASLNTNRPPITVFVSDCPAISLNQRQLDGSSLKIYQSQFDPWRLWSIKAVCGTKAVNNESDTNHPSVMLFTTLRSQYDLLRSYSRHRHYWLFDSISDSALQILRTLACYCFTDEWFGCVFVGVTYSLWWCNW
jgi:hypothetical protein